MTDLKKHELPDDDLDNVTGGVEYNQVCNCNFCARIDYSLPVSCSNCYNYDDGDCPYIALLK